MVSPAPLRFSLAVFLFTLSNMVSAQQGEWTWMHGCNTSGCSPTWGTQGVPDPANTPGGVYAPYYWVDAQKNLWIYGGIAGAGYFNAMWKFDPSVIEWTWMAGSNFSYQPPVYGSLGQFGATYTPGYRAFGSVSWTDNDGKFWLFGGDGWAGTLADLWQYDPSVNQWALMNGSPTAGVSANYGTKGVPAATNTPGSRREGNATWVDADNNLWMFGGETSGFFRNDMWKYDVSLGQWVWMAGSSQLNQAATYGTQGVADSLNVPSGRSSYCKWQDADGNFWLFGGGNWNSALASVHRNSVNDPGDVMFARSTDGGATWDDPVRVNDDPTSNETQWFGTMSVAQNGRIDAVWLDTREANGSTDSSALYYSYSIDQGETWSANEMISDLFNPHVGYPNQNKMGDYFDMVSDSTGAYLAWANTLNGEQDVYFSHIVPQFATAVNENAAPEFSVFPNPTSGSLVVTVPSFSSLNKNNRARIEIMNALGDKIMSVPVMNVKTTLNLSLLPAGIYLLRVPDETGNAAIKKIVIE